MNRLLIYFGVFFLAVAVGCAGDDEGKEEVALEIVADKTSILADGEETVIFTVYDKEGGNVTSECVIVNGKEELATHTFSTMVAGEYEFSAKRLTGGESGKIKVLAVAPDVQLSISADKTDFVGDGGDIAVLKLSDDKGNDLTADAEFYIDGGLLKRNAARSAKLGKHVITAKWKGKMCEKTLSLNAVAAPADFTGRLLVEFSTSTSCMYCPAYITALKPFCSNPRFALVTVHREASTVYDEEYLQKTRDRVQEFVDYYGGYVPYPGALFNRDPDPVLASADGVIENAIPKSAEVGIAVEALYDGLQFTVKTALHPKKDFDGHVCAVLVEDGIWANQVKLGEVEIAKLMRDYQPSVGGEPVAFKAGVPVHKEYVFDNCGVKKTNKCEIIVLVTGADKRLKNVQRVAVGKVIGY